MIFVLLHPLMIVMYSVSLQNACLAHVLHSISTRRGWFKEDFAFFFAEVLVSSGPQNKTHARNRHVNKVMLPVLMSLIKFWMIAFHDGGSVISRLQKRFESLHKGG